jgi:DNA-directed RNA polymerase subunit M/transcription elongation factor TFIIS
MLEFCPVCKRLLQIKKEDEKNIGFCSCGFKRTSGIQISSEDNTLQSTETGQGFIDNKTSDIFGVDHLCKKCGNDKAEVFELSANEASIFVYRCLKCGFSEREVQGSSKF